MKSILIRIFYTAVIVALFALLLFLIITNIHETISGEAWHEAGIRLLLIVTVVVTTLIYAKCLFTIPTKHFNSAIGAGVVIIIASAILVVASHWHALGEGNRSQLASTTGSTLTFDNGYVTLTTVVSMEYQLATQTIDEVRVTGPGGNTTSAAYIKWRLQDKGLTTTAYGQYCYSACTIIWTAGENKVVEPKTLLGFHRSCLTENLCEVNAYLYDGFLTPSLIKTIANPGNDAACPLFDRDVEILSRPTHTAYSALVKEVQTVCKDGVKWKSDFLQFGGYEASNSVRESQEKTILSNELKQDTTG